MQYVLPPSLLDEGRHRADGRLPHNICRDGDITLTLQCNGVHTVHHLKLDFIGHNLGSGAILKLRLNLLAEGRGQVLDKKRRMRDRRR